MVRWGTFVSGRATGSCAVRCSVLRRSYDEAGWKVDRFIRKHTNLAKQPVRDMAKRYQVLVSSTFVDLPEECHAQVVAKPNGLSRCDVIGDKRSLRDATVLVAHVPPSVGLLGVSLRSDLPSVDRAGIIDRLCYQRNE